MESGYDLHYDYYYYYDDGLEHGLNMSNTSHFEIDHCLMILLFLEMNVPQMSFVNQMSQENCRDYFHSMFDDYKHSEHGSQNLTQNSTIHHFNLTTHVQFYLLAIIIPIGLLFNLLSCIVFFQSCMQKSSTVFYFFALACADNIVLLGELLDWLNTATSTGRITGLNFVDSTNSACRFVYFLQYFGRLLSSWLVVIICIERFITVMYPMKSAWSSPPKRAMMVILGVTALCMTLSCPPLFMLSTKNIHKIRQKRCIILDHYKPVYEKWILCVRFAGDFLIPSIIVIIFTTLIIIKLKKAQLQRMLFQEGQSKGQSNCRDHQPTIALLAVSIAFVTLRTPYVIIMCPLGWNQRVPFPHYTHSEIGHFFMALKISYILAVTNYAVNFFIYIITGQKFRNEFMKFLLCKKLKFTHTWSRSSRSYNISSKMTNLRRFSNGKVIQGQGHHPVATVKISSSCQETQL